MDEHRNMGGVAGSADHSTGHSPTGAPGSTPGASPLTYSEGGPTIYWRARAEKAEAAEALQRGMADGYKDRAEKAEAERDALAAALEAVRPLLEEIAALSASNSSDAWGYLKRACAAVSLLNQTDVAAVLTARDLAQQQKGGREALEEMKEALRHKTILVNFKRALLLMDLEEFARTWTPRERRGGEVG